MASSFTDRAHAPEQAELDYELGDSATLWHELEARIAERFPPLEREWTFAGKASGWSLRLKRRSRAIVYLTPYPGRFNAAFALGEKAVEKAREAGLPERVWAAIDAARRYAEGRAVRLPIEGRDDLDAVVRIADAKMST